MSRRWQQIALFAFVLYITFIGGAAYATISLIPRFIHHVVMTLVLGGWLLHLIRQGKPWPRTPFDWPLLLYVVWLFIVSLNAVDPRISLEATWPLLTHVALFYFFIHIMQANRQRWIFSALFLTAAVVVMVSAAELLSWYFGLGFAGFNRGWFEIGGFSDPIPPERYRLSLALNVSNLLGNYVAVLLPITLAWSLTARRKDDRRALQMVVVGLLVVALFTDSRGSVLAIGSALAVFGFFRLRSIGNLSKLLTPSRLAIAAIGIVAATIVIIPAFFLERAGRSIGDEGRIDMWESAIEITADNPIFGVGIYQFGNVFREYRDPRIAQDKLAAAHNLLLNTTAETGIPGGLILMSVGIVFLIVWYRTWTATQSPGLRVRLEGILAALVGFNVHSMLDTFTLTASVLPILAIVAFVAVEYRVLFPTQAWTVPHRAIRYISVAVVGVFFIWLVTLDLGTYRLLQSINAIAEDDYDAALDHIQDAQSIDPALLLYDLHEAYVLGLLAEDNPTEFLARAIDAHVAALEERPTFDIAWVNLAALYAQQGDYENATLAMERATEILPNSTLYWLKLGEYREAIGHVDGAIEGYWRAIEYDMEWVRSAFWNTETRQAGLEAGYERAQPTYRLFWAVYLDDPDRADEAATQISADRYIDWLALGHYYMSRGDYAAAIENYQLAGDDVNPNRAEGYAHLAQAYLENGDEAAAETAAETALFLDAFHGARANYVLAQLNPPEDELNDLLAASIPSRVVLQEYAAAVFARPAAFSYLPQLQVPGFELDYYAPWLELAEHYATDDDDETDPQEIYDVIRAQAPYLEFEE